MKTAWDDRSGLPLGTDGKPVHAGHIASRDQAERWQSLGYDIAAAADRYAAFARDWENAPDEDAADALVDRFYAAEQAYAAQLGIDADRDADAWRFAAAPRHHEFA